MLRRITFNNFYSFLSTQEISFLARRKSTYTYTRDSSAHQISKVATFVGGNASGKTNIMRLLSFFKFFICQSSRSPRAVEPDMGFKTFFDNTEKSTFFIEFEIGTNIYFYTLIAKEQEVLEETLYVKPKIQGTRRRHIFIRKVNTPVKINKQLVGGLPRNFSEKIRPDVSLIAFVKANYAVDIFETIWHYFNTFKTNINEQGKVLHPDSLMGQVALLDRYMADTALKLQIESLLYKFDTGLKGFDIIRSPNKEVEEFTVKGLHIDKKGNDRYLDFIYESSGTKALFFMLGYLLDGLKDNSIVLIDEFETGLHPEAVLQLLSFIMDSNANGHAQILFTTHSLEVMRKLDMHQIYLIEKSKNNESDVYRLNEVEGIRSDENFLAKYLTGAYGGFPKINLMIDDTNQT